MDLFHSLFCRIFHYLQIIMPFVPSYIVPHVYTGNLLKFSQNEELKQKLLDTENKILVEASPYDKIWGIGLSVSDKDFYNPILWKGENLLGKILMKVRNTLN